MRHRVLPAPAAPQATAAHRERRTHVWWFVRKIKQKGDSFHKRKIDMLPINMGKYCNQACLHCHVEAEPGR